MARCACTPSRVAHAAAPTGRVEELAARETAEGYGDIARYESFAPEVEEVKRRLLAYLIEARDAGRRVVGYGAPGKGNTLLNYCGIRSDLLEYTVDRNPYKHGRFLPGTHIPDPPAGADRRDPARRHPDPALEPRGGDRASSSPTPGSGAPGSSSQSRP